MCLSLLVLLVAKARKSKGLRDRQHTRNTFPRTSFGPKIPTLNIPHFRLCHTPVLPQGSRSLLKIGSWTLSNLCDGQPRPVLDVHTVIPALAKLLQHTDSEILRCRDCFARRACVVGSCRRRRRRRLCCCCVVAVAPTYPHCFFSGGDAAVGALGAAAAAVSIARTLYWRDGDV